MCRSTLRMKEMPRLLMLVLLTLLLLKLLLHLRLKPWPQLLHPPRSTTAHLRAPASSSLRCKLKWRPMCRLPMLRRHSRMPRARIWETIQLASSKDL